jgi:hypothetical protein
MPLEGEETTACVPYSPIGCERRFRALLARMLQILVIVTEDRGELRAGDIVEIDHTGNNVILRCHPRNDVDGSGDPSDNYSRLWRILRDNEQLFDRLVQESNSSGISTSGDSAIDTRQAVVDDEVSVDADEDRDYDSEEENGDDDGDGGGDDEYEDGDRVAGDPQIVAPKFGLNLVPITANIPEKRWYRLEKPNPDEDDAEVERKMRVYGNIG